MLESAVALAVSGDVAGGIVRMEARSPSKPLHCPRRGGRWLHGLSLTGSFDRGELVLPAMTDKCNRCPQPKPGTKRGLAMTFTHGPAYLIAVEDGDVFPAIPSNPPTRWRTRAAAARRTQAAHDARLEIRRFGSRAISCRRLTCSASRQPAHDHHRATVCSRFRTSPDNKSARSKNTVPGRHLSRIAIATCLLGRPTPARIADPGHTRCFSR